MVSFRPLLYDGSPTLNFLIARTRSGLIHDWGKLLVWIDFVRLSLPDLVYTLWNIAKERSHGTQFFETLVSAALRLVVGCPARKSPSALRTSIGYGCG
jgi:hypothetical protein